jgi:hypothetical protein
MLYSHAPNIECPPKHPQLGSQLFAMAIPSDIVAMENPTDDRPVEACI